MFGRTKMYKKGLADALEANKGFMEKQQAAIEHMRQEIRDGKDMLQALRELMQQDVGNILEYLDTKEKEALYKLANPFNLKNLEKEEKQFLLAVLYQLAHDEGDSLTENQRAYIGSLQQYLKIVNPQTNADLQAVENIDSIEIQKAFLQTALEFFYLQDTDQLSDAQEDFLSYFSLNKRQAEAIELNVSQLYNALGPAQLAVRYGPVLRVKEAPAKKLPYDIEDSLPDPDDLDEISLAQAVSIGTGGKTYSDKIIHFRAGISCQGALTFENCILHYAENEKGKITLTETGKLTIKNCRIIDHHKSGNDSFFITAESGQRPVEIDTCHFTDAGMFLRLGYDRKLVLRKSFLSNAGAGFVENDSHSAGHIAVSDCFFDFPNWSKKEVDGRYKKSLSGGTIMNCHTAEIVHCVVKGDIKVEPNSDRQNYSHNFLYAARCRVEQCSFYGMSQIFNISRDYSSDPAPTTPVSFICDYFDNCAHVVSGGFSSSGLNLCDCLFEYSTDIVYGYDGNKITRCQFNNCCDNLINIQELNTPSIIDRCEFNNWKGTGYNSMLSVDMGKGGKYHKIQNCVFNGMQVYAGYVIYARSPYIQFDGVAEVENCKFSNWETARRDDKLISEKGTYVGLFNKEQEQTVVSTYRCTGLDRSGMGTGHADEFKRRVENDAGEKIGAPDI